MSRFAVVHLSQARERGLGVMFRCDLKGQVFVFTYPEPSSRLFHTFFCPPLRILALDDDGRPLSDGIVPPNRFKRLPAARIIVECSPGQPLSQQDLKDIASSARRQAAREKGYARWTD